MVERGVRACDSLIADVTASLVATIDGFKRHRLDKLLANSRPIPVSPFAISFSRARMFLIIGFDAGQHSRAVGLVIGFVALPLKFGMVCAPNHHILTPLFTMRGGIGHNSGGSFFPVSQAIGFLIKSLRFTFVGQSETAFPTSPIWYLGDAGTSGVAVILPWPA